ncbi:hypothetical protein Tco_1354084 [Tanacetum coccineum]
MSSIGELTFFLGLQVKQKEDGIFISQDKYVGEILKKFGFSSIRTASTPMETNKALTKDEDGEDVDVHLYRSMIGSLMYLTSSRPDIMFSVCACSRFQVQPKVSHLNAVKRIFRYLKGQPKLGLWYPKDSPLILEAFSDSDYAGASLDRKSTTGGCQFLGSRLISWQCKKQTVVANSTTEAEYIAASHCCGQVLWIQNQMLDYGFNFMQTKIHVDNESAICVVKNPVYHSKTKHIEIRHHFIRDSYEKRLIEMVKIHTDHNVADLLTKAFDVSRFNFLVASIGKRGRDTKIPQSGGPPIKVGDEAVHKELGDRMERAATTVSSLEVEQDSDAQTRFEAASKSPMTHLSQELTHLEVGRTVELTAAIDGQVKTITKASLRRHLKLEDNGGVTTLPNSEIFEQLALMGPKKTAWEQFSSNITTAIICLATNRTYNFSKLIFDVMIKNLENPHKFLMYPRFIQIWLNKQRRLLQPYTRTYPTPILTQKVFSNMKRVSRGYSGVDFSLFPTMISAPETSPSRITSSPSLSPQHTPVSTPQPPNTQPTPDAEEAVPMPHESPLHSVHSLGRDEGSLSLSELTILCTNLSNKVTSLEAKLAQTKQTYGTALTKLIKKVKKLEQTVKSTQAKRRFRIVESDDEEDLEDSSKQGRKITEIDQDPSISLVHNKGTSWIQEDIEIQEKFSDDTEVVLEEEEPTELVKDQGSGEKGEKEVSTVGAEHSTVIPEVSTAAANLVYIRRSAHKRKDKGKAIMKEDESVQKKTKKQLEQERGRIQDELCQGNMKYEDIGLYLEKEVSRKKSLAREKRGEKKESTKRQKDRDDIEKEELKSLLDLVSMRRICYGIDSLGTKADGSSKNYKIFSEMLDDFDRQDVLDLHRLVKERYATSRPEGYDLMLWGDLKTLFELDEEDEVWRNHHSHDDREEVSTYSRNAIKDDKQKTRG